MCQSCHKKTDPLIGAWNSSFTDETGTINSVSVYNEGGTYSGQSDVDIGVPTSLLGPPGYRLTISTGKWEKVGCRKYRSVDSNVLVRQGAASDGLPGTPLLRIKKTSEFTLSKVNGCYQRDGTVIFSQHLLTDLKCKTPIAPPSAPTPFHGEKLDFL